MKILELGTRSTATGVITLRWTDQYSPDGRPVYEWAVMGEDGNEVEQGRLEGPVGGDVDAEQAMLSLTSFIGAGIESRQHGSPESENWSAISDALWNWIEAHDAGTLIETAALDLMPRAGAISPEL